MSELISFKKVKKTRKIHHCTGCGELIKQGEPAYAWTCTDNGTIFTLYLHDKCGEMVEKYCSSCKECGEDGLQDGFIAEAHLCGRACDAVKSIYGSEVE